MRRQVKKNGAQTAFMIVRHIQALSCLSGQIHSHVHVHTVIELAFLAWESSRGPEQDTQAEIERNRERETAEPR